MRVLVVDDHELVRKGICSVLESEPTIQLCGEALDGLDAVRKAQALRPDLVVMDITMPNLNGLEATREIRRILPDTEVLVLTQHDGPEMLRQAYKAGAQGYVVKSAISSQLLDAIAELRKKQESNGSGVATTASKASVDSAMVTRRDPSDSSTLLRAQQESEALLRSTMNSIAEGLFTVDMQGRVTYVNPAAEEMFGWSTEQLLGKKMHDVTHYKRPDGSAYPEALCPLQRLLKGGEEIRQMEEVLVRRDGTFMPVVFSASPLRVDGITTGIVVSFRDDTQRLMAEEKRKNSEGIYRAIGETMDYGIWISDATGKNIYMSPSFLRLLNVTQEQSMEMDWSKVLHPDEAQETVDAWHQCVREGKSWDREYRIRTGEGKYRHVLARGGPVRDSQGNFLYWAGIHLDIQEREEAEIALQRTTQQFQLVTDTMAVGVARCSQDERYLWVNAQFASWVGRAVEDVIGKPIIDVLGAENFEKLRPFRTKALEGQRVSCQDQLNLKGGRRWISTAYSPTFGANGRPDGFVASLVDITDRKEKEAELSKQARLLDLSFNAVFVRDHRDRISYWNRGAEELYGWKREEAQGWKPYDLLKTVFPEPLEAILAKLRRGEDWQGELVHTRKDGSRLTVLSRWALTRDPESNSESITEINIDVTQTKEAEQQLHMLVQTLEERIVERTRDLESATQKLRELSGRLMQIQDEERRRIARELHDGVGQLLAALKMNLSKVTREQKALSDEAILSLRESTLLIDQASQEIRTMSHLLHPPLLDEVGLQSALRWFIDGFSERSKINVQMRLDPGFSENLPRDMSLAIFRIVQESLTNVHRHSGSETAQVLITRTGDHLVLEVQDEGTGIPEEVQRRIASGESAGVGLRGMRERIRQFGGKMEVRSSGRATKLTVLLPLPTEMPIAEAEQEEARPETQ